MEEEKITEKITGYILLITLLVVFGTVLFSLAIYFFPTGKEITVYFPKVGELKLEQPFYSNGIKMGEVISLEENVYNGVAVTIKLSRTLQIRKGYQFYAEDIDLFGYSKRVVLINGPLNAPTVDPDTKYHGMYFVGIPEIIAAIGKLESALVIVRSAIKDFMEGDPDAIRLLSAFKYLRDNGNSIVESMNTFENFLKADIVKVIEGLSDVRNSTVKISNEILPKVPEIRERTEDVIAKLDNSLSAIPEATLLIDSVVQEIGKLDSTDQTEQIKDEIVRIQNDLVRIKDESHNLKILLRKYPRKSESDAE